MNNSDIYTLATELQSFEKNVKGESGNDWYDRVYLCIESTTNHLYCNQRV